MDDAAAIMEGETIILECSLDRVFEVNLVPFLDARRCIVLVFHDVSEKEKLERIRRDFVANVSHELKTPLTSIKGYAETLLELFSMDTNPQSKHQHFFLRLSHAMLTNDKNGEQPSCSCTFRI